MALKGTRPYLIRAINEWIIDQGWTPHLLVNAVWPGAQVPEAFVEDGRIVLNINPSAVRELLLANTEVCFSARFAGMPHWVQVPMGAILGIYARENGEGLFFEEDEYSPDTPVAEATLKAVPSSPSAAKKARPSLRVVK
ncbi:MAG: ClpXP protease specificity-enhancing factor [Pseudomonadota bacterium]